MTIEIDDINDVNDDNEGNEGWQVATGNDEFDNDHIMINDGDLLKQSCPVSLAVK